MSDANILRLGLDQPTVIQLKYPTARTVPGLNGPELRWILMDGRILYTPFYLGAVIAKLNVKAGSKLIVARLRPKEPSKRIEWSVEKLSPPCSSEQAAAIPAGVAAHQPGTSSVAAPAGSADRRPHEGQSQPGTSSDPDGGALSWGKQVTPGQRPVAPSASGSPAGLVTASRGNQSPMRPGSRRPQDAVKLLSSGSDHYDPHGVEGKPGIESIRRPPSLSTSRLAAALKTAVSAAHEAEQHGQAIDYPIRFAPADIRAMAISVLIAMSNGRAA